MTGAVTAKHAGRNPVLGAAAAWLGIFTPGVLMMFALLPWWSIFRRWPLYRRWVPLSAGFLTLCLTTCAELALPPTERLPASAGVLCNVMDISSDIQACRALITALAGANTYFA